MRDEIVELSGGVNCDMLTHAPERKRERPWTVQKLSKWPRRISDIGWLKEALGIWIRHNDDRQLRRSGCPFSSGCAQIVKNLVTASAFSFRQFIYGASLQGTAKR